MGLFSTKIEEELVIVLEISSGRVSGALVLKNAKETAVIIATAERKFYFADEVSAIKLQKEMLDSIDRVCSELQAQTGARPAKVYCVLAMPWSHGEVRSIYLKKEKEFKFSEILAGKMVADEVAKFKDAASGRKQIIDKKITAVALNGYSSKSPNDKYAREARVDVFLSVAEASLIESIQDKIHKTFKSKILFTSQMLADFVFARSAMEGVSDFLTLDVGEEITEVLVSKNGDLSATAFFPFGTNGLMRLMAKSLNKSPVEIMSLVRMLSEHSLETKTATIVEDYFHRAAIAWTDSLKEILSSIFPNRHIPHQVLLLVSPDIDAMLGPKISHRLFPEFTTGNVDFDVIISNAKMLHDFCVLADDVRANPHLIVKTVYINQS